MGYESVYETLGEEILNTIDEKYIDLLKGYGIDLKIVHIDDLERAFAMLEKGNKVEIQLNLSKISAEEYETYLSYNVRKIILPVLKLETERLKIRRFEMNDANAMFEFLSDRESCYLDGGYEPYTEKNTDYYGLMSEFVEEKTRYTIVRKDTDELIGMIHLMETNDRAVEVMEIGYTINPSQRRCGYAMEAVEAMLNYLLHVLHLDMVIAGAFEKNMASLKMIEKLGFIFEGRKRKGLYHPVHGPSDLLYFYMEREN